MLGPRLADEPYSGEDRALLRSVAAQAGLALESIRLAETMAARLDAERRQERELEIAKDVQAKLLPQHTPAVASLDYAGRCVQARQVGGDFYDFVRVGASELCIVLADISGKGMSAALLMASLQANLRGQFAQAPARSRAGRGERQPDVLRLDGREPLRDAVRRDLRRALAPPALRKLRPSAARSSCAPRDGSSGWPQRDLSIGLFERVDGAGG